MNHKTHYLLIFAAFMVGLTILNLFYLKISISLINANKKISKENEKSTNNSKNSTSDLIFLRNKRNSEYNIESGNARVNHSSNTVPTNYPNAKKDNYIEFKSHHKKHRNNEGSDVDIKNNDKKQPLY